MLNVPNITTVRDKIAELDPSRFNMKHWAHKIGAASYLGSTQPAELVHNCNTCGCIGGWTQALFDGQSAGDALGLSWAQEEELFYPAGRGLVENYSDVTQADAVVTLTKLIETGEVDWSHVQRKYHD